jgi:RNA polymerase sigma-70 factor (ECF subfamily)
MSALLSKKTWDGTALTGLWRRVKENDTAVFEELVSRYEQRFYRVAYRMTGSHEDAQDLLQEALIEAYKAFSHFRKGSYFDKWLFRIMSRTCIDSKRVTRRLPTRSLEDVGRQDGVDNEFVIAEPGDLSNDPGFRIEREVLDERIQDALAALSPNFRLVLILADIEQMSYDEIAEMLECPVGTVRSRLHRARSIMLKQLQSVGFSDKF